MLIDKTDISNHREISKSVRDDKINPYIEDAEMLDLKPLLGNALYFDLVKNSSDEKYVNLLEPKEFVVEDITYKHVGIKKVLSIFANARYVLFGSHTDTGFGLVQKSHQDSVHVSQSSKRDIYTKEQQTASQYFSDIAFYLNNNTETYTLWNQGCKNRFTGGFRISKIS